MALTNPLVAPPTTGGINSAGVNLGGSGKKYTISAAEIAKLGAFTTGGIIIETLPPGSLITYARIKHSAPLVGTSLSAATARVVTSSAYPGVIASIANSYGAGTLDVFAAAGNTSETHFVTHFQGGSVGSTAGLVEAFATNVDVMVSLVLTGANASAVSSGSIDVWLRFITLGV